MKVKRYFRRY